MKSSWVKIFDIFIKFRLIILILTIKSPKNTKRWNILWAFENCVSFFTWTTVKEAPILEFWSFWGASKKRSLVVDVILKYDRRYNRGQSFTKFPLSIFKISYLSLRVWRYFLREFYYILGGGLQVLEFHLSITKIMIIFHFLCMDSLLSLICLLTLLIYLKNWHIWGKYLKFYMIWQNILRRVFPFYNSSFLLASNSNYSW